jgi:flagellar protein FlaI
MKVVKSDTLQDALKRNPHLKAYLDEFKRKEGVVPSFVPALSRDMKSLPRPNLIYPVGDPIFIHIYTDREGERRYIAIEPRLTPDEEPKYRALMDKMLEIAPQEKTPKDDEELEQLIDVLIDKVVEIVPKKEPFEKKRKLFKLGFEKIRLTREEVYKFRYLIKRDVIGVGPLEPLIRDPYIEDIHVIGPKNTHIVHKIFDMLPTNIDFKDEIYMAEFLKNLGERIGRPVSERNPIVDGTLPDGSRINIIYSPDVSLRGPSFTIRKFTAVPLSITQLINWGTLSAEIAAYLWLCLEYGMSIWVSGETASGKTTTLNAMIPFIKPQSKIYTAEDTPEVQVPHPVWQQLCTRERGSEGKVDLFDLLKAALRSRPNYIIVGEIRGKEGAVAFQAMQTGHPVLATFHAGSVKKLIQRLTGEPINVPITFIDNLNVVLIQQAVYRKGQFLRRCLVVEEIEGYYEEVGGVVTRTVFEWDSVTDKHNFRGLYNSYILENKIAQTAGFEDPRQIYEEMFLRARILQRMVELKIFNYFEVTKVIWSFYKKGLQGLPFRL